MNVTLQLRHSAESERPATAWWLAGNSATEWLNEMARWPVAHGALRLLVVPGASHGTVSGVLVVVPSKDTAAVQGAHPAGVAYGCVGERLFVPVDAKFVPPASDAEVDSLLPDNQAFYVWQPARGLIACDTLVHTDVAQLVAIPPRETNGWDRAVPGTALNDRLISIEPFVTLEIEQILQEARGDIGTQVPLLDQLPRSPSELRSLRRIFWIVVGVAVTLLVAVILWSIFRGAGMNWRALWTAIAVGILAFILFSWFLRWARETATRNQTARAAPNRGVSSGPGGAIAAWFAGVRSWVAERAAAFDEQLEALRHREVDRLLHMLDARPDEGLRYAMPLTGQPGRGVARPGSRLIERLVEFSFGRLGGSGPSDYWDIGYTRRAQLVEKYRELANREIALGRHRRAAYIFAELLGDLRAAAATLADGGHFREAAALYDQRLKDPRAAAKCLERGGLLSEAIVFYYGFSDHEKVGELYEMLEQWDFAEQAYRRAATAKLDCQDYLGAAQLWELKLRQPEEALDVLRRGWPDSSQASLCLDESFKLLARQAAHEHASRQVTSLADGFGRSIPLVTCFARVASTYPDSTVQLLAADQTRVLASHQLLTASPGERHKLLQAVQQLAPQDRLLARDCARFENPFLTKPRAKIRPTFSEPIRLVHEFKLPDGDWKTVIAIGDEFYAAGFRDNEVLLIRGSWDGTLHQPAGKPWRVPDACAGRWPIMMSACPFVKNARILLHVLGTDRVPGDRVFPKTDWFDERTVGGHVAFDPVTVGMHVSCDGVVHTVGIGIGEGGLSLMSYSSQGGELLRTFNFSPPWINFESVVMPWIIARMDEDLIFNKGTQLVSPNSSRCSDSTPSQIRSLVTFGMGRNDIVIALLEFGGFAWFGSPLENTGIHFAEELSNPFGCCRAGNSIVIADATQIQVYKPDASRLRMIASKRVQLENPIALLEAANRRAALFLNVGRVLIYEFN